MRRQSSQPATLVEEPGHLGEHPEGPEQADGALVVAERGEVERVERVQAGVAGPSGRRPRRTRRRPARAAQRERRAIPLRDSAASSSTAGATIKSTSRALTARGSGRPPRLGGQRGNGARPGRRRWSHDGQRPLADRDDASGADKEEHRHCRDPGVLRPSEIPHASDEGAAHHDPEQPLAPAGVIGQPTPSVWAEESRRILQRDRRADRDGAEALVPQRGVSPSGSAPAK